MLFSSVSAQLEVKVTGVETFSGTIYIGIYSSEATYMVEEKAIELVMVPVESMDVSYLFEGLQAGNYAITLFQDLNSNKVIDKNFFGVPNEPYGFSNNARGIISTPTYEETSFYYSGDSVSMNIKIY